jgi:hypothetical protein
VTLLWQFANTPPQLFVYSGKMEAMRQSWTDDRMDDLVQRVDKGFSQVHGDIASLRGDNRELRREMVGLGTELRRENKTIADELRRENKRLGSELRSETASLRLETNGRFNAVERRFNAVDQHFYALNRRFDTLQGTLLAGILAGFIGLLVTHFA